MNVSTYLYPTKRVENYPSVELNFLPHKMNVKFNMFGVLMLYCFYGEINYRNIISVHCGNVYANMELIKKVRSPTYFGYDIQNPYIFDFGIRSRSCDMLFRGPGDKIITHKYKVSEYGAARVKAFPVCIGIGCELESLDCKKKTIIEEFL